MGDAGRVAFVLKNEYDNNMPYEYLDVVTYNNVLYCAKRDTVGNAPTGEDDDNWKVLIKSSTSGDFVRKSEVPTLVKVDGTTITKDADGTLHGSARIDVDTELSETSTNPLTNAKVTEELGKRYIKSEADQKLSDVSDKIKNYVAGENITFTVNQDGTVSISGSGGSGSSIPPKPVVNPIADSGNGKVTITWGDPTDIVYDGILISEWAGTKLVMKEDGYPTSPTDGTLLVDNTERDVYKTSGFEVTDLTEGTTYYFTLFPYSKDGVYNYDAGNRLSVDTLKIVTFADGTDEEIAAMVQAHYDNKINITDYWAVGDKRSVNLSAMSATGVGESHRAQTVQMAIADFEHDDLTTAINGHTKAAVTLTQVNCLMDSSNASSPTNGSGNTENGYMNSSNTNSGGWTSCARRTWCNNVYYNALPSTLKSAVKEVKKFTSAGSQSSTINTTNDKVFLLSEIEIFGSTSYSKSGEGSQYSYYKTTANRYKNPKWSSSSSSNIWWERSPHSGSSSIFCLVDGDGSAGYSNASSALGITPCLCI